jgi:hypothetical protein
MSHTVKIIAAGFALLAVCLLIGRATTSPASAGMVLGAKVFLPLWLAGAGINMWVGVSRAAAIVERPMPMASHRGNEGAVGVERSGGRVKPRGQ